jgi:tetratricopeptide (TPR) repeat protein
MLSIVLSLAFGVMAFVAGLHFFGWGSGIFLGLLATGVPYFLLARRVSRLVQGHMKEVERLVGAQQMGRAIEKLNAMRFLARWQILLDGSLEAQIGMLRYAHLRKFDEALPHLQRAPFMVWQAKLMLGAYHFRKKQYDQMVKVFERVVKRGRKESLAWLTYAWCEWKRGEKTKALAILARGREKLASDERLARMQEALQNGGKPKTRGFGNEWLALHLEDPPQMAGNAPRMPSLPPHLLRRAGVRLR